jgi:death-on-curing family protein
MPVFLTLKDVENLSFVYAKELLSYNEPIPDFNTRYPEKLEAVLALPGMSYGGKLVYQSLEKQASVLFYEMIKQHPFFNGNKRIACVSLLTFLTLNKKWLKINWQELYEVSKMVAESDTKKRTGIINKLCLKIVENLTDIE